MLRRRVLRVIHQPAESADGATPPPATSVDESALGWSEREHEEDRDAWLRAERPPHWG